MVAPLGLAIGNAYAAGQEPPTLALQAGAAKVEITPPASALNPGDAIRDPLFVRALFIRNGLNCAVLVGADQGNIPTPVVDDAVQRATVALGCPAGNFIVSATHTHSGNTAGLIATGSPTQKQVGDAIVKAAVRARASSRPARVGYGTTEVYLNVNRDLFEGNTWYQGTNRVGPSDKTLAIIEFVGADGLPIGVYMNYAMHPINFYLSGLISADFPGEASRYIERRFPGAIALFSQGASGDQNPLLDRPFNKLASVRTRMPDAHDDRLTTPDGWKVAAQLLNANVAQTAEMKKPITSEEASAYGDAMAQVGEIAASEGALIGESAIDVMKNLIPETSPVAVISSLQESLSCPGRDRVDTSARQGVLPVYTDGEPVNLRLGLLKIGDIAVATVNGEVYSEIAMRLKKQSPSNKLMMVTLANGRANSGYIYSNNAAHHLTFQVIGARLKPGCAEDQIVTRIIDMDRRITRKDR
jgi:neutral ceramidase